MFDINEQVDNVINVPWIAQIAHRERVVLFVVSASTWIGRGFKTRAFKNLI